MSGNSSALAGQTLTNMIPVEELRRQCLGFLAESIGIAYLSASDRWGLTVKEKFVRLNVGKIEVLAIFRNDGRPVMHCLIDLDTISDELYDLDEKETVQLYGETEDLKLGFYKSVAGSIVCDFYSEDFQKVAPLIQNTHHVLIEHASRTPRNPMTKKSHCPAAIDFLAAYLGREIHQPTY